jgi:hypothetical protein
MLSVADLDEMEVHILYEYNSMHTGCTAGSAVLGLQQYRYKTILSSCGGLARLCTALV